MVDASAGVVMDNNLMVCGGLSVTYRLWVETATGFNRYYKRGSEYLYRPYLGFQFSKFVQVYSYP